MFRNDFETLIHQCRKRKWKDGVVMILDAMRQMSESGWELSDSNSSEDTNSSSESSPSITSSTSYAIAAQPHLRPTSKTYVSIVDAYLVCGEEKMAWDSFLEVAQYPELSRDPALYRKFIRGTYLLTNCDHISEMLELAREDNVAFSHRTCVELARMHGFLHQDGLDIIMNQLPGPSVSHEKKQALLEELVLSCGYKHNAKGVEETLQGMLKLGYCRSALTETAVVVCCLQHQELADAMAMLRHFQSLHLVMQVPMYDSLLREMYFKYTRRGGVFDESSRKVALRTLYSRRALFDKVFAEMDTLEKWNKSQSPVSEDVFTSTLSSAEHHQLALQYWCERSSLECSALMFAQHVVELITTIRDKDSKASAQTAIYKALLNTEDPFLFNLRAVVSLRFLDLTFRALGKLAKQLLQIFGDNGVPIDVQSHHSAYCIAQLPDLTVHVMKEIDEVVALHASHRKEILSFCYDALENDNMDKTIGYLVHKEALYTLETAEFLVPKLAELYVLNGFITVLQFFKPEVDDSDAMRRLFLREVIEIETIADEDAVRNEETLASEADGEPQRYQCTIKAITELKMQHEDEFMPFLMHLPTRAIRTDEELHASEDPSKEYLKIPIDDDHVVIVDNDDAVALAYEVLMYESVSMLGLDAEWRPDAGKGYVQSKCSILQVACETHVFIFDLLELALSDLEDLFAHLFASKAVVKLGFGLDGDIKRLRWSFPETRCFDSFVNVVDFSLDDASSSSSSSQNEGGSATAEGSFEIAKVKHRRRRQRGLAGFVHETLGLPLSKAQQKSDWERRPLSPKQVSYAALDAYCLVMVHQALQKQNA